MTQTETVTPKKIWKYELGSTTSLPIGAEILDIQVQGEQICLWAAVDPDAETEMRYFQIVPTGGEIKLKPRYHYLKTIQEGALVWHVCEVMTRD